MNPFPPERFLKAALDKQSGAAFSIFYPFEAVGVIMRKGLMRGEDDVPSTDDRAFSSLRFDACEQHLRGV